MEQNEIETLKASIKSSETQLANLVSENVKLKTDSKQIVQELEHNLAKMENDSIDNINNFSAELKEMEYVNANLQKQLTERKNAKDLSVESSEQECTK